MQWSQLHKSQRIFYISRSTSSNNLQRHIYLVVSSCSAITCMPRPIRFTVVYIKPNKQRWWSGKKFSPKTFPSKQNPCTQRTVCVVSIVERVNTSTECMKNCLLQSVNPTNSYRLCYGQSNRKSFHEINYRRFEFLSVSVVVVAIFLSIRMDRSILSSSSVTQRILQT